MRDDVALASGGEHGAPRWLGSDAGLLRGPRAMPGRRAGLLVLAPLLCAAVYAVAVLADLHTLLDSIYVDSDAALAPVLGEAIGHIPAGSFISLGNHAWYEEWLFLLATRGLPDHRQLWEIAPLLWSVGGLALLLWTVRRVLGASAAALCGAALLCVGPFGRFCFLAINWHSVPVVHTVVVLAGLLWLCARIEAMSWPRVALFAAGLGVLCAVPTASDSLFSFWALIPLLAAAFALLPRLHPAGRRRLALAVLGTIALGALGALALASTMRGAGVTARTLPVELVHAEQIGGNLSLLVESFVFIAGGRLSVASAGLSQIAQLASATLALLAVAVAAYGAARVLRPRARDRASDGQLVYATFWATCIVASAAVFVASNAPKDALSGRYLLAAYVGTAALLPLAAPRGTRGRSVLVAGVCLFAAIGTYQLIRQPYVVMTAPGASTRFPGSDTASALARFAQAERVGVGYGGYWDAESLTWGTDFKFAVRPVRPCSAHRHTLCYPQLGMVSSWYLPRPHTRSILIVDPPGVSHNVVTAPDPQLGRPIAHRRVGVVEAYVYQYDIASRLHVPKCGFSWAHPC